MDGITTLVTTPIMESVNNISARVKALRNLNITTNYSYKLQIEL